MRPARLVLRGGDLVLPERVLTGGALVLEAGRIADVLEVVPPLGGDSVRWVGGLIVPGFVDLHSDAFERAVRPRPGAVIPLAIALLEFDRELAGHGITTFLHAVAVTEEEGARSQGEAEAVARAVQEHAEACLVRHWLHTRYELTDSGAAATVRRLLDLRTCRLLSFMDHTPGERQFATRRQYVAYFSRAYGLDDERIDLLVREKLRRKAEERPALEATLRRLTQDARARGIVVASHDDATAGDVTRAEELGASIAEFPTTAAAAAAAKAAGLHVVMGAPNVVRGHSASGNLSAREALTMGTLDSLCSDYYPGTLLHAVTRLVGDGLAGLAEAVRLVTLNPARALGADSTLGSLEPGKAADVVIIDQRCGLPVITRVLRDGREVLSATYEDRE